MGGSTLVNSRKVAGFSLVEILVAVAIIGCLALMVGGWYGNALDRANNAKCTGNVRAIVLGALNFAMDRDGKLWSRSEVGYSKYRMADDPLGLPQLLKEYVSKNAWLCPAGRKSLRKFGNNYTWNATVSFEKDNVNTLGSLALVVWDTYAYSLPSMFNASDDFKGDGSSATGPQTLNSKYHLKPHFRNTAANWGRSDGSVVSGATAAQ